MSESESGKAVVDDLLQEYESKVVDLNELERAIRMLSKRYGIEVELPPFGPDAVSATAQTRAKTVQVGQFYGKSGTQGTAAYLELVDEPKTLEDILDGLKAGGLEIGGKDPRTTLYTQLVRATHSFVKLPTGHFGLLDWFPEEKDRRSRRSKRGKRANSGASEKVDESSSPESIDDGDDDDDATTEPVEAVAG